MAHPKETQLALRAAFLSGSPLELAAVQCGIGSATARRWKADALAQGDDWDKFQKASLIVAGGGFDAAMGRVAAAVILRAEAIMEQLGADDEVDAVSAAKAIASLADSLGKAKAAMRAIAPELDQLAIETSAVKAYCELLMRLHPTSGEAALSALEAYSRGER
ncbi:DUF1804 family protein [Rhodoferax sp.]|uniref:DUF1804 family protein n=1 Tax=Rhodoferax sp. TaxID=50421 RepID=UPI00260E456D|nr:DUF1804 family protein [Rhodoferax sp.]MDD2811055.1 DUF1804 family protein [Rhodoferax sp.]MDD4942587.1 DUF1804 family protein [Rhodoferax sp.]